MPPAHFIFIKHLTDDKKGTPSNSLEISNRLGTELLIIFDTLSLLLVHLSYSLSFSLFPLHTFPLSSLSHKSSGLFPILVHTHISHSSSTLSRVLYAFSFSFSPITASNWPSICFLFPTNRLIGRE